MERGTKLALAALAGVGIAVFFVRKASASEGGRDPRKSVAPSKDLLTDLTKDEKPPVGGSTGGGSTGGGSTGGGSTGSGKYASKNAWGKGVIKAYQERLNDAAGTIKHFFDNNPALVGDAKLPLVAFDPQGAWGTWGPKTQATSDAYIKVLSRALAILENSKDPALIEDLKNKRFRYIQTMYNVLDAASRLKGADLTPAEVEKALVHATYDFDVDKLYMSQQDYWAFRAAALSLVGSKATLVYSA